MTKKVRVHNEYFRSVARKSCPCGSNSKRNAPKHQVYSWFEYHNVRQYNVDYFCEKCFATRVRPRLVSHMGDCGCSFNLIGYQGEKLPAWLTLEDTCSPIAQALAVSPWEQTLRGVALVREAVSGKSNPPGPYVDLGEML